MIRYHIDIPKQKDMCSPFTANVRVLCGGTGKLLQEITVTDFVNPVWQLRDGIPLSGHWECGCGICEHGLQIIGNVLREVKQRYLKVATYN